VKVPAAVRFLSSNRCWVRSPISRSRSIHWVIVGGESGPGHRPIQPEWVTGDPGQCGLGGRCVLLQAVGRHGRRRLEAGRWTGQEWSAMPSADHRTAALAET
jgi:protein gp37